MNSQPTYLVRVGWFFVAVAVASVLSLVIGTSLAARIGSLDLFVESPATVGAPSFADPYREFVVAPAVGAPSFADPYREFVVAPAVGAPSFADPYREFVDAMGVPSLAQ